LPKLPILDAKEAEKLLKKSGFSLIRTKGSNIIYSNGFENIVIPYHSGKTLHPKIVKSIFELIKIN